MASTYRCPECGKGKVALIAKSGRRMRWRHIPDLHVPSSLEIPTCSKCGSEWLSGETATQLDAALEQEYAKALAVKARDAIAYLRTRGATQKSLEHLLGLSQGYLSKIKDGKETSAPLVAVLALLAGDPRRIEELEEAWRMGEGVQ